MIPSRIAPDADAEKICALAAQWKIVPDLSFRIHMMAGRLPFVISIISGYRTAQEQIDLDTAARPTAPDHLSTHRSCPATGADLRPALTVTREVKLMFGEAAVISGLRWGGGSPLQGDIPLDWNHVDLGRRQ